MPGPSSLLSIQCRVKTPECGRNAVGGVRQSTGSDRFAIQIDDRFDSKPLFTTTPRRRSVACVYREDFAGFMTDGDGARDPSCRVTMGTYPTSRPAGGVTSRRGIERDQRSAGWRGHVVPVDRPGRVELLHKCLQLGLLLLTPVVLLEGGLIDKAVPRVGHHRTVGQPDRERPAFRPGLAPGAGCSATCRACPVRPA